MRNSSFQSAILPNLAGADLPPTEIPMDARYQIAVTCGAQAAAMFLDEDQAVSLHAHLPASLAFFLRQSRQSTEVLGLHFDGFRQVLSDAFIAGYFARIQQELRLIRPSPPRQRHAAAMH